MKSIKLFFLTIFSSVFISVAYADLTFVSWGGAYTMSQQKAYIDTWGPYKNGETKVNVEN